MKKSYLKPESTRVELVISNLMQSTSKIPVGGDGGKVPSPAGEGRGQWGDVWK